MESSKMLAKCFLCTREFEGSESKSGSRSDHLSITESSFMLNQILELPKYDLNWENYMLQLKFQNVCYCSECLEIISNVSSLAVELEILEEKVSTEKRNIVDRLRQSCEKFSEKINGPPGMLQMLRTEIISEIDKVRTKTFVRSNDVSIFSSTPEMKKVNTENPAHSKSTQTENIYDHTSHNNYQQNLISEDRFGDNVSGSANSNNSTVADSTGTGDEISLMTAPNDGTDQILNDKYYDEDDSGANIGSISVLNMNIISFKKEKYTPEIEIDTTRVVDPLGETDVTNLGIGIDQDQDSVEIPEQIQNKSYICATCDEIFDECNALEAHVSTHHNSEDKIKKSPANEEQNVTKKRKKSVRASKKRDRTTEFYQPKECEECGKILSNHAKWKDHVLTLHRREGNHKCNLCDYTSTFPAALKRHMTSCHSDARNFECDVCKKKFKRSDHLQSHKKTHAADATFQCLLCSARFMHAVSLQDHHTGQYCTKVKSESPLRKRGKNA